MGRALEPGLKLALYLDFDMGKPVATRPVFWMLAMSWRESTKLADAYDEYWNTMRNDENADAQKLTDGVIDLLTSFVVGWDNQLDRDTRQPIPFSRDAWVDVVDKQEAFELIRKGISASGQTVEEKKSSG